MTRSGEPAKVLLVTPVSPWSASSGAQQRTALLYDALAQERHVDILVMEEGEANHAARGERPEVIARLSWKQPLFTLYKYGINAWTQQRWRPQIDLGQYRLVVSRYVTPITKIAWPRHVRTLVDCDDAYYRYAPRRAGLLGRSLASTRGWLRLHQTRRAIRKYDHAFFCSRRDERLFRARSSSVLRNAVRIPAEAPAAPRAARGSALIVASLWYAPNRHGVDWFITHCWPAVARQCPGLKLRIVGAARPEDLRRWSRAPRVEAPGFLHDLAGEYAKALFTVAPIHHGGGTCIKFLEAGAFRRACVTTAQAFEGYSDDFRHGESAFVARDAEEMVRACAALYADVELRRAIGQQSHDVVTRLYNVERFRKTVGEAVHAVLDAGHERMN